MTNNKHLLTLELLSKDWKIINLDSLYKTTFTWLTNEIWQKMTFKPKIHKLAKICRNIKSCLHWQTQPCVTLESSVRGYDVNGRRLERKFRRENQFPVINPAVIRRLFRPRNTVMPLEHVRRQGLCNNVGHRIFFQSHIIHTKAADGRHWPGLASRARWHCE